MRRHLMHLLGEDYQLELAGDGETALAAMRREAPDLVVSDLMMPVLDGYGMLRAMRAEEKLRTIPVILLSARAGEEERLIGLAAGAADYLAKPFTARELRSRVRAQMDLAQARHRAEATQLDELTRASERKFRNLAEAMPQIVWTTDPAGLNTYFNRHWAEYTGLSLEESHGEGWIKPFHPEDRGRAWEAWRTAVNRRGSYSLECRLRRADGEYRWWLIRGVPQVAESGEILQWFGTCTDIEDLRRGEEERRQLEAQVMMAQKLDSLGSLAGGVAHDMNNVLGAIGALAEVHRQAPGSDAALRRDMDTIAMACRRGGNLVKGLLSFARSELVREVEVDLNAVVREEILLLERTTLKKVRLEQDLEDGLAAVLGDPGALHHCLMNLCVNAVDAMPAGGTLTLRTRAEAGGRVLLEVADTGIGMPREVLDKALDPFFTTKAHGKGTGLGLSMVYGTVKTHQGTLEIESEPGAGTRVRMRFPAAPAQARSASAGLAPRARTAPAGMSVFIVDDDELILSSIPGLVQSLGHIAITAGSGEQALAQLEAGFRPDVLCLDLNMPGLDGIETLRRLRRFCPDLPVLITTGRPDQQALDLVASQPRVALLPKPFGADELVPALEWAAGWAAAGA
jgi:PAS domain S-box-containing protein